MPVCEVQGRIIHTVEEGPTNRQLALLIHGWSSSWYAMSPLLGLVSQRFRAMAIDLPGYGQSPPLKDRATIPAYADVLAELIAEVADGPVVLIGHSMGGMIALTLALRQPVLVERMVLIAPTISGRLSFFIDAFVSPVTLLERFGLGSLIVSVVENLFVGLTDRFMRPASFAERSDITEQDYKRLRADARQPGQGRVRAECFRAMRENDLRGRLREVEAPAMVLWGAEDNTVPLRDASVVADEWPQADLRIIPKAGHWPHFEAPDATRRHVAAFLGLPRVSTRLHAPVGAEELARIDDAARFLAHSDVGNNLNHAQRTRLAAQFQQRTLAPGEHLVRVHEVGNEVYIVQQGTVEVWSDPENPGAAPPNLRRVATYKPGQITGELAMLDGGVRSADLRAGPEGATVLTLSAHACWRWPRTTRRWARACCGTSPRLWRCACVSFSGRCAGRRSSADRAPPQRMRLTSERASVVGLRCAVVLPSPSVLFRWGGAGGGAECAALFSRQPLRAHQCPNRGAAAA